MTPVSAPPVPIDPVLYLTTPSLVIPALLLLAIGVGLGVLWETYRPHGTAHLVRHLFAAEEANRSLHKRMRHVTLAGPLRQVSSSAMRHLPEQRDRRA